MITKKEKFKLLLKKIFQYDKDKIDLDFGVYRVFKHKEDEIQNFISKELPSFIEENIENLEASIIYNHTLEFFERYFQDGDFYPIPVYSTSKNHILRHNGEEVIFSWANKDQYYIKSIENFSIYKIRNDNLYNDDFYKTDTNVVNFVVDGVDETKGNNKTNKVFTLSAKKPEFVKDDGFNIYLNYKNSSSDIKEVDDIEIFEIIQNAKINLTKDEVTHHIKKFKNLRKTDFFIHKHLEKFLNEELDYYLKTKVLKDISTISEIDIKATQILQKVCQYIIKFISSLEELQKMLWEKKKFAYDVNYIVTLDKLNIELLKEIIKDKCFKFQVDEWKELGLIGKFDKKDYFDRLINELKSEYKYLPLDTKYFDEDIKYKILEEFDSLDEQTDGILINSDNYHGLNYLQNRFKNKIKCVYIDPPYNTGDNQFAYKDNYQHSSWLSMMQNRLSLMKNIVNNEGRFFCSIDDRENSRLLSLLYDILDEENYLGSINWEKRTKSQNTKTSKTMLQSKIEYIHPFRFNAKRQEFNLEVSGQKEYLEKNKDGVFRYQEIGEMSAEDIRGRETMVYPILGVEPKNGNQWKLGKDTVNPLIDDKKIILLNGKPNIIVRPIDEEQDKYKPLWSHFFDKDIYGTAESGLKLLSKKMGFGKEFQTVKPVELIYKILFHSTNSNSIILDFFGGSGTTAHATLNINRDKNENRKYILMETNEYFDSLLIKRTKKSIYTDNWKDAKAQDTNGISQLVKYYKLEQYEDTLENSYLHTNIQDYRTDLEPLKEYMNELYTSKYLTLYKDFVAKKSKALIMENSIFNDPFNFILKVNIDSIIVDKKMDLVETFNTLKGLEVNSIKVRYLNGEKYIFVDAKNESVIWREFNKTLDIQKELEFIKKYSDMEKTLYMNGITQTHTKKELIAKELVFELRALVVEGVNIDE